MVKKTDIPLTQLKYKEILSYSLGDIMQYVDASKSISTDVFDNLYYALISLCEDNPDVIRDEENNNDMQ
jgi:hypothetical protein